MYSFIFSSKLKKEKEKVIEKKKKKICVRRSRRGAVLPGQAGWLP